jgi:hypothetical protein
MEMTPEIYEKVKDLGNYLVNATKIIKSIDGKEYKVPVILQVFFDAKGNWVYGREV